MSYLSYLTHATFFIVVSLIVPAECSSMLKEHPTKVTGLEDGPVTIFVHGTVFPYISSTFHGHDTSRTGLHKLSLEQSVTGHNRFLSALAESDPEQFHRDTCYSFYWSGGLSIPTREEAAQELYGYLQDHKGPLTIIGHSHGASIALHLAECCTEDFSVDRLILLAAPVQRITSHLIKREIFKRIYCCYSGTDIAQVIDPQVVHSLTLKNLTEPFFSGRIFPEHNTLTQARLFIDQTNPGHQDVISSAFGKQLPSILILLDKLQYQGQGHAIIRIESTKDEPPSVLSIAPKTMIEIIVDNKKILVALAISLLGAWKAKDYVGYA